MLERRCCVCNEDEEEVTLNKCPMCTKWYCEDCETTVSGRRFCSSVCANYFFFGEE